MAKTEILTKSSYTQLVTDIRKIIEDGRLRASEAARQELVRTYWDVGRRISQEGLIERGGYGDSILKDLSDELEIDFTTLTRSIHFFQTYKTFPADKPFSWSQYKFLIPLADPQERKFYETLAVEQGFNTIQLAEAIKKDRFEDFKKDKGIKGKQWKLNRPKEATYVYKALVERVIDGDTLLLRIDLGFTVWKEQRVRLAGIDTPPLEDPKGREAFRYVRDQLAKTDFVMIRTNKIDIYGRYVGHIFYSYKNMPKDKVFEKGRYLNQELVDHGFSGVI